MKWYRVRAGDRPDKKASEVWVRAFSASDAAHKLAGLLPRTINTGGVGYEVSVVAEVAPSEKVVMLLEIVEADITKVQ